MQGLTHPVTDASALPLEPNPPNPKALALLQSARRDSAPPTCRPRPRASPTYPAPRSHALPNAVPGFRCVALECDPSIERVHCPPAASSFANMAMVQPADMAVKANEILARFRPIAPKPAMAVSPAQAVAEGVAATNRVLCQLQSRPCRARKRGRQGLAAPAASPTTSPAAKRKRAAAPYPPLPCAATTEAVATAPTRAHVSVAVPAGGGACVPIAPRPPAAAISDDVAEEEEVRDVPVERDLLRKLLEPKVISPRAVRPVGSTIRVESIHLRATDADAAAAVVSKTAAEVEAELEADALPAVVSDSSNRVRLVNDAYKEMVGQPECPWLRAVAAASRRISGEVVLAVAVDPDQASSLPDSHGFFACTARIEWERGGKCTSVSAPCDVSRLQCESRDYLYTWRFRTSDADASVSSRSRETSAES
ncbi:hypothetical protein EJB05_11543, partial [Eragrostis curvula]